MLLPDLINGLFESFGTLAMLFHVRALYRDKLVRGFHPGSVLFFTSWGIWNLWYYPHLSQWLSFFGGAALCGTNLLYTGMTLWYIRHGRKQ